MTSDLKKFSTIVLVSYVWRSRS